VHTKPEEKPIFELSLRNDGIYNLYSGENDGALTIKTSGNFYLGDIAFSDNSSVYELGPVITLISDCEDGNFNYNVYINEGDVAKLKYESLPNVGTHEYTLHVEIPGTDYTAEAPVTINVIDGTTVLPREIVLLPETEALFTNDVYNQSLYLDSNGKASVSLDLARDDSNESPNLHTVCDKFIYCHDECTKGVTEDRKYMFTFDGAGQHYVVLHLASDYSNWYVERPLTFNVLDPEPVITSEPYYPPYITPEEPTAMPTAEPIPVPTQAPTAEPVPVPTVAPTVEPAPTPTPAPIMEVTTGGRNLNVRLSPVNGDVVVKLPNGTRLEVLGTENGWSRVRATLPDGTTVEGYVMDVYLSDTKPTPATATSTPGATLQPGATPTAAPTAGTPTAAPTAPASNVAKVTTDGSALRMRSGPNTRSDILVRMPNNAEVTVLETVDGWTRIRFTARDGKEYEGWASADFIKPAERPTTSPAPTSAPEPTTPPQPTATPKPNSPARVDAGGKRLNMRTQPGAGSDVVVKLPADAELIVIEYGEKWSLCSYNGVTGYCATAYLKFN
ncbi:MAG: SH3 domain-containing protein, partial [Candidatus Fimadaptatus sp.]|nr:SH3 domain-containing protein [Candidatus Fimadaptatus sp.]